MKSPVWWTSFHSAYRTTDLRRLLEAMRPILMPQLQQVQPLLFNLNPRLRTASYSPRSHLNQQVSQRSISLHNRQALEISNPASYHSRRASSKTHKLRVIRVPGLLCRQCQSVMGQISLQCRLATNRQCLLMLNLLDGPDSGDL